MHRAKKSVYNGTLSTLKSSPVNYLLIFVPLGIIAGELEWSATARFLLNFFAIVPLASVLAFATEEISEHVGQTVGGLLNATFGNAVELIVSIIALKDNQVRIVQASMLGSILSNLLLVLGCCFCRWWDYKSSANIQPNRCSNNVKFDGIGNSIFVDPSCFPCLITYTKEGWWFS